MNRSTKILLLTLAAVFGGIAFWLLRPRPAKPNPSLPAPVAHTSVPPPVAPPTEEPLAAQQPQSEIAPSVPTAPAGQTRAFESQNLAGAPVIPVATVPIEPSSQPIATQVLDTKPQTPNAEIAATARMYAAHASLRTPEVADPDSRANKQILQTMVLKALSQPASLPPTARQP